MRSACLQLLVLAAAGLAAVPVAAQRDEMLYDSGNAFVRACSSVSKASKETTDAEDTLNVGCIAYVRGLSDGIKAERYRVIVLDRTKTSEPFFCEKKVDELEGGQAVRILLKYIRNNPETANNPVGALFMFAMREAFPPCPESSKTSSTPRPSAQPARQLSSGHLTEISFSGWNAASEKNSHEDFRRAGKNCASMPPVPAHG